MFYCATQIPYLWYLQLITIPKRSYTGARIHSLTMSNFCVGLIVSKFQLISIRGELCMRGYWNTPDGASKTQVLQWFDRQIERIGLSDLKDGLYFPQGAGKQ